MGHSDFRRDVPVGGAQQGTAYETRPGPCPRTLAPNVGHG